LDVTPPTQLFTAYSSRVHEQDEDDDVDSALCLCVDDDNHGNQGKIG